MGTIRGKVTKVETSNFNSQQLGPMQGHRITVESDSGQKVTVTKNTKQSSNFTLAEGTQVNVTYEPEQKQTKTGSSFTVNKIVKDGLVILNNEVKPVRNEDSPAANLPTQARYSQGWNEPTNVPSDKDISMEVSGLLQAIINHHGYSNDTETLLRNALKLKRLVAAELKDGGLKDVTPVVKAKKAVKVEEIDDEYDEQDECPFDV